MNLKNRIEKLERGRTDQVNDLFYDLVCHACQQEGQPIPPKQGDLSLTLKQLAEVLPA
jgi:hypothetical protein